MSNTQEAIKLLKQSIEWAKSPPDYGCDEINRAIALLESKPEPGEPEKIRADFLWPAKDGSVEAAGYEFANAKTEAYQKQWWDILQSTIKEQSKPGEFTISCNKLLDLHKVDRDEARAGVLGCHPFAYIVDACDIIDSQAAEIKGKDDALEFLAGKLGKFSQMEGYMEEAYRIIEQALKG